MPTSKPRISLTLPSRLTLAIKKIAKDEEQSMAYTIVRMLQERLELEEDQYWDQRAMKTEKNNTGWTTHEKFWKGML